LELIRASHSLLKPEGLLSLSLPKERLGELEAMVKSLFKFALLDSPKGDSKNPLLVKLVKL
jgi:tRNA1(Val) A37 N6-methylase TrmN6